MIRKPLKDGLGKTVRGFRWNPVKNILEHEDDLVHVSSYDMKPKEPKLGSREHKLKFPARYASVYTSSLEQAAFPEPGTAPSEKRDHSKHFVKTPKTEVKVAMPVIDHSLLRNSVADKAKAAALEQVRVFAFTPSPNDAVKGIGSLTNSTVKKLKAADWLKGNQTTYKR